MKNDYFLVSEKSSQSTLAAFSYENSCTAWKLL